ncbi:MAG: hypothetical protein ACI4UE_05530 [Candidatus Scatovivens sp.]
MENNLLYSNVATELLEIFKYFDKTLKENIPSKLEEMLFEFKNEDYIFKIDKTKKLNEQKLLPETRQILSMIYLKYCCTQEEANEVLEEKRRNELLIEEKKRERYNIENIFHENPKKEESSTTEMIVYEENTPIYIKIVEKIKEFFKNILIR